MVKGMIKCPIEVKTMRGWVQTPLTCINHVEVTARASDVVGMCLTIPFLRDVLSL
jgi:hypothetical protein